MSCAVAARTLAKKKTKNEGFSPSFSFFFWPVWITRTRVRPIVSNTTERTVWSGQLIDRKIWGVFCSGASSLERAVERRKNLGCFLLSWERKEGGYMFCFSKSESLQTNIQQQQKHLQTTNITTRHLGVKT